MRVAEGKRLLESGPQTLRLQLLRRREQSDVRKILDARIRRLARYRGRVECLGDVRLDRVEPERRRCDTGKGEDILCNGDLGLSKHRAPERNVDAKGLRIDLAGEFALGAETQAAVLHAVVADLRMFVVRADLEAHELAEVLASGLL